MSTLELEHLKHTSSSSNNLSVHSDGSLTLGNLTNLNVNGRFQVGDSSITQAYPAANLGYVLDVQASAGGQTYISIAEPGASSLGDTGMIIGEDTTNSWIVQRGNKGMNFSTNDLGRLLIDGSGRVTKPYQPAFRVGKTSAQQDSGGAYINPITFDVSVYNIGNHFNLSTDKFTAPIAGRYLFGWMIGAYRHSASWMGVYSYKNNAFLDYSQTFAYSTGSWHNFDGSILVNMAANDTFHIVLRNDSNAGVDNSGCLCGYLVG